MRLAVVAFAIALVACSRVDSAEQSERKAAKEKFAIQHSCPEDRLTLVKHELTMRPSPEEAPPPEVKADPGRLAKWQADHKHARENEAAFFQQIHAYDVSGCNVSKTLYCTWGTSGTTHVMIVTCDDSAPPFAPL